ncbi:putative bifunctional diguanylate cyclase/phosphodiesterase [Modestobacter sp. SSW1-42]|uniref:putative bifunctional diguanylate cyclase/phosphodiesterase n=1 Tax=Modestobacter sp. SSW1-42 TaxID=596372 RepID=UPI0039877094
MSTIGGLRPAGDDPVTGPVAASLFSARTADATALLVVDRSGAGHQVSWANEAAARLLSRELDDVRGRTLGELLSPMDADQVALLLSPDRTTQMTMPVRVDGVLHEVVVVAMPEPSGGRWTIRIISTANELERALRATADAHERRFAAVTERSPVPLLLSEQGMRLAHVNEAFCTLVGAPAEQLLGTGWLDVVAPDDLDRVVDQVAAVLDGADAASVELNVLRRDDDVRRAVLRLSRIVTPGAGVGFVGTLDDITERLAYQARLEHQANHDPLTGLPNRTLLHQSITARFTPGADGLACLFLDIDDFKAVNDSLGHTVGDLLLVELAARLRTAVRPGDLVARFGGDEFVVVCSEVSESEAVGLALRLLTAVSMPFDLGGVQVEPGASIGVTLQNPDHLTADDLVRDCDIAMYQAKAAGRGRVALLDQRGRAAARAKLQMVADLRDAVQDRGMQVWYQPIVGAADQRPIGVESLARWTDARRGPVSPEVFVPLAEESGLIGALGMMVLEETCRQLAEWDAQLGAAAPPHANVNISALQLDRSLPGRVAEALQRHGLEPRRLALELTESSLMGDPAAAREILQALRDLGIHLAIDDFGTGYSSLAYLRHLPVNCLKVDRSFVAELADGNSDIAAMVIALARTLGLTTVAEGVESAEQAAELARLGVSYLQGFFLARPMTGADCGAWFADRRRDDQ